jgi:hypothetical protein
LGGKGYAVHTELILHKKKERVLHLFCVATGSRSTAEAGAVFGYGQPRAP